MFGGLVGAFAGAPIALLLGRSAVGSKGPGNSLVPVIIGFVLGLTEVCVGWLWRHRRTQVRDTLVTAVIIALPVVVIEPMPCGTTRCSGPQSAALFIGVWCLHVGLYSLGSQAVRRGWLSVTRAEEKDEKAGYWGLAALLSAFAIAILAIWIWQPQTSREQTVMCLAFWIAYMLMARAAAVDERRSVRHASQTSQWSQLAPAGVAVSSLVLILLYQ